MSEKSKVKITSKYIREQYDIEIEKRMKLVEKTVGNIEITFDKKEFSKKDIIKKISGELNNFDDDVYFKEEFYGYDGAFEIVGYKKEEVLESDNEVIERLKRVERAKRKKAIEIEKAKKLLRENDLEM